MSEDQASEAFPTGELHPLPIPNAPWDTVIGHENAHARMSAFLAIISAIFTKLLQLKPIIVYNIGTVTVSPLLPTMRSLGALFHRL